MQLPTTPGAALPVPRPVRTAQIALCIQAVRTVLATVLSVIDVGEAQDAGHQVSGAAYLLVLATAAAAVLALGCAIGLRRRGAFRVTALVFEAVVVLFGLIDLATGTIAAIWQLAFGGVVLVQLARREVGAWYRARAAAQRLS